MAVLYDNDDSLLELVRTTFDAHSAVLFLPDRAGNYEVALASTESAPFVREARIAPGRGLVGWILRHRQSVIVNDLERHSRLGYYAEDEEEAIVAFMGCHLPRGGALCIDSVRPRAYTEDDQALLLRFARHIARQAHSEVLADDAEDLRRYLSRLERLADLGMRRPHWNEYLSGFLSLVAESSGFDYVAFATSSEGASTYPVEGESAPLLVREGIAPEIPLATGGLVGWVFRNEAPVHAEGGEASPAAPLYGKSPETPLFQSVICLPVFMNRVVCGVLCLAGMEPRALPEHLRSFARVAVSLLSRQLETLYLRHRLQSLLPRARIHRDGSMAYDPDTAPSPPLNEDD